MLPLTSRACWEYRDLAIPLSQFQEKWSCRATHNRRHDYAAACAAQQVFWPKIEPWVRQQLRLWLDEGWEISTDIGPECIVLTKTELIRSGLDVEDIFLCMLTLGISLVAWAIFGVPERRYISYRPAAVHLQLRRLLPCILSPAQVMRLPSCVIVKEG